LPAIVTDVVLTKTSKAPFNSIAKFSPYPQLASKYIEYDCCKHTVEIRQPYDRPSVQRRADNFMGVSYKRWHGSESIFQYYLI